MPKLAHTPPAYRLHKASGQAIVTLDRKDVYLGPHGTPASRAEYDRVVAEWLANGRRLVAPAAGPPGLTVEELILQYWKYAELHYGRDGRPSRELDNIRDAMRPVRKLYAHTPAANFGPLSLKTIRRTMIDADLSRKTINYRIGKVRRCGTSGCGCITRFWRCRAVAGG